MSLDLRNMDCMDLMREYPDKHFELAIVDPPYGDGDNFNHRHEKLYQNKRPSEEYFSELFRVSSNQIIFGGNYFSQSLTETKAWICWDKMQPASTFADFELAWTSFNVVGKLFKYCNCGGFISTGANKKIHPTQKPIALYKWLLHNYAKKGDKILDTHLGSGSIAIACHQMGFDLTGSELDKDYFEEMQKRIKRETAQLDVFQEPTP